MIHHKHIIDIVGKNQQNKLIIVGAMHGNERNGVDAINNILPILKEKFDLNNGTIYFLKGNIEALQKGERFLEKDLNRLWQDKYINAKEPLFADIKALQSLHTLIVDDICEGNFTNCTFLDLHTFSANSGVFCIPSGNNKSIALAQSFGVSFVEKLSEKLPGTALEYFGKKGMTSVVFEGGTHNSKEATKNLEAAIWNTLAYTKMISNNDSKVLDSREQLQNISRNFPHHLELIYRHKLRDYQNFKMLEGYYNFKPITKAEKLAFQDQQEILSPSNGYMLMPLYQKKGSDGFFIVKEKEEEYV